MFVIRDCFNLKFGKAREAREALQKMMTIESTAEMPKMRVLTDFTGDAYRMIMEAEYDSLGEYESNLQNVMKSEEWQSVYREFVPLVESSSREILRTVSLD